MEVSDDCYRLRWYSNTSEYLLQEDAVNGVVHPLKIHEAHEDIHSCLRLISCSLQNTNTMSVVERSSQNLHCSSGKSPVPHRNR